VSRRLERVGEQIRAELARLLREEIADPRVAWVTVLRVDVSPDLRNALVWWSRIERPGGEPIETIAAGLASVAPFARRRLARALPLKRMPALTFRHDAGLEEGDRVLSLLRDLAP
jgi:ribosome-binding factor A